MQEKLIKEFTENYMESLFYFCLKKTGDSEEAQDLTQDIALNILSALDEPTGGLDPVVRDEVVEMFYEFTRDEEHSILISSHIVSDLERLCDYVAFLHHGKLLLWQEKDALLDTYCGVRCTREQLATIPAEAILHKRETPYGVELVMKREDVPQELARGPITIEELFVTMVKEARA